MKFKIVMCSIIITFFTLLFISVSEPFIQFYLGAKGNDCHISKSCCTDRYTLGQIVLNVKAFILQLNLSGLAKNQVSGQNCPPNYAPKRNDPNADSGLPRLVSWHIRSWLSFLSMKVVVESV